MYFFISTILSAILLHLLIPKLRIRLIDMPNERSSHNSPKPTGGGIVFVIVGSIFAYIKGSYIPLICLPLALVGFLDDLYFLRASIRYAIQFLTALSLLYVSPLFESIYSSVDIFFSVPLFFISAVCITAIINFSNFMDGLDGLLAGCMIVLFILTSLLSQSAIAPLIGALIVFLIWNWSPSKVFMGDVGSTFLGAVFSGVILQSNNWIDLLGALFVASPLLLDSSICVIRRYFAKQNIFEPHSLHLFQRLHQSGWSHASVSIVYILTTIILAINYMLFGLNLVIFLTFIISIIGIWLDRKYAIPFSISRG